jgi:hypothetical protein
VIAPIEDIVALLSIAENRQRTALDPKETQTSGRARSPHDQQRPEVAPTGNWHGMSTGDSARETSTAAGATGASRLGRSPTSSVEMATTLMATAPAATSMLATERVRGWRMEAVFMMFSS